MLSDVMRAENDNRSASQKAEFSQRTISKGVAPALQKIAAGYVKGQLRDPDSAQLQYDYTTKLGNNTGVCGRVNAKNGYGGYSGFKVFYVEVQGGQAISGGSPPFTSADRVAHVCGYVENNRFSSTPI